MTRVIPMTLVLATLVGQGRARDIGPEWPQVKVDRVDALDPGRWRVFVTALGEGGKAISVLDLSLDLYLAPGREPIDPRGAFPLTRFKGDVAAKGFSGKVRTIGKSDVRQAAVVVIASHSDVPPDVREAMVKALLIALKGLRKDALTSVLLYGDVIQVLWSPDGQRGEWRDIREYQECLGRLRREATHPPSKGPGLPCGSLAHSAEVVAGWVRTLPPGQGLFPRLFGIKEAEEVLVEAERRGHTVLERHRADEAFEPFAEGAVEAAARLLMVGSEPEAERLVILLSDGRDGYLRVADLASERISRGRACTEAAKSCLERHDMKRGRKGAAYDHEGGSPECTREVLECAIPKVARGLRRREEVVSEFLGMLMRRLRAGRIRVHAISLPTTDEVGSRRLQALTFKTGGTLWTAQNVAVLEKDAPQALADAMKSQVVIYPPGRLDADREYSVVVSLGDEERLVSAPYRFRTGPRVFFFERPLMRARGWVLARVGHDLGPPVFWMAVVLATLMTLSIVWKVGKGGVGLAKRLVQKGGVKAPKVPKASAKVPTLKRPGK